MQVDGCRRRYVLALDLKENPALQRKYVEHHRHVWPDVLDSLRGSGVMAMEIFKVGNRLCMVMDVNEDFSFEKKAAMDASNPSVQAWEELMETFQQRIPYVKPGEKWALMEKIFEL